MANAICPICRMDNAVDESAVGRSVQCLYCRTKFTVEHLVDAAPAPVAKTTVSPKRSLTRKQKKKIGIYLAVACGIAALVLVYIFIIHPLIFYGLPRWTKYYISQDTVMLFYVDAEELNDSKLAKDLEDVFAIDSLTNSYVFGATVDKDRIKDMLIVIEMPADLQLDIHVAIRLTEDMSLADFAGNPQAVRKSHRGIEYIEAPLEVKADEQNPETQFLAKMDECIFCMAESEAHLKKIIEQVKDEKTTPLPKDLQDALDEVSDEDSFLGIYFKNSSAMPSIYCKSIGIGITIDSSLTTAFAMVFTDNKTANEAYEGIKKMKEFLSKNAPEPKDEATRIGVKMLKDMDVSRSGCTLCLEMDINGDEVKKIVQMEKNGAIPLAGGQNSKNLKEMLDKFRRMLSPDDAEPYTEDEMEHETELEEGF